MQKTKDALLDTDRNLRLANDKAQEVTIKKLGGAIRRWQPSSRSSEILILRILDESALGAEAGISQ
jgi:hypothetical protein